MTEVERQIRPHVITKRGTHRIEVTGDMDKSTYCWWQLLVFACLLCCHTSDLMTTYGKIIPQSPVVEIGKNFTATCVLYSTAEGTADDIFWTCKDKVPEEQYTKINDSAVSVTIKITKETCKWLLCKRRSRSISNLNTQITGIMLTKGYPPEKPTNLSCMAEQSGQKISSIVMCSWIPGTRDEELVTIFSLHCRRHGQVNLLLVAASGVCMSAMLSHICTAEGTADDIFWTCKDKVPEEQYTKINDSAVSVTIKITEETCNWLICERRSRSISNVNTKIHGIMLTKGYPPEKPTNLSCIAEQSGQKISSIVMCSWIPGTRHEILDTKFSLYCSEPNKIFNKTAERSNGFIDTETFPNFIELTFWVEVTNSLGTVRSDDLIIEDANYLVKPNPPLDVHIISENTFPRSVLVKWKQPIDKVYLKLKYNIHFKAVDSKDWSEVPRNETQSDMESFRLQRLMPYTKYEVRVRCIQQTEHGYWSNWSVIAGHLTPEDKPSSKPDLWRVVIPSQGKSERTVNVTCKDPVKSNGWIRNYSLKIQGGGLKPLLVNRSDLGSQSQGRKIIQLHQFVLADDEKSHIELNAWNSAGESPKASLTIPKLTEEPHSVKSLSWFTKNSSLWVEWAPPTEKDVTEYILEWVSVSDGALDWQREDGRNSKYLAEIRGDLEKFKRYNVSVYPLYSGKPGKPRTEAVYLEQKAPKVGPVVKTSQDWKNEVELEWTEIPLDDQQGFITNYTISYTTGNQENFWVVPANTFSHTLKNLTGKSKYVVKVMASTVAGGTWGTEFTFNTLEYDPGEMAGIVVSVCMTFLFLVVSVVVLFIFKMERIKKKIWPPVPDPSNSTIANWSPDFPYKKDAPGESGLGDVSVVEVDVFEDRQHCEEDKAGLPLKKDKYLSEEHSSGIGGSSCMSSPRQSVSDSDEGGDSGQTTASTVQYSSVVAASTSGYKGQTPQSCPSQIHTPSFVRSESTQPLLESEEQPESREGSGQVHLRHPRDTYFRRSPAGNGDDDGGSGEERSGNLADLNQLEMGEHRSTFLRFSPVDEGSPQATPMEEDQTPDIQPGPMSSYLPQLRGARPQ
ncbi:hypothetical protein DPEC_G00321090 [Dallia pectoralis]|uniref:Uncharacterized protein n=1 Tax=Dallia pectoralis TaxID=75939 RepID=A0ACC2FA11_DALPE|nr:hypothetical protein DPEC_G00321090 [Dallia pectoralis]